MTSRPVHELRALSEHLLYEAQMLFLTANRLRLHVTGDEELPWELEMAAVESFAVHARVLIEFFWHEPSEGRGRRFPDDGFAADFFEGSSWAVRRAPMEATLDAVWSRASREIAHLTYKRTTKPEEARSWRFDLIAGSIGRTLRLFVENVDRALLVDDFERRLRSTWPAYLNYAVAISFPPEAGARSVATTSLQPHADIPIIRDEDLIP
jgi:hypothetical protein